MDGEFSNFLKKFIILGTQTTPHGSFTNTDGHLFLLKSLHSTYPLTKRTDEIIVDTLNYVLTDRILPTSYINNNSSSNNSSSNLATTNTPDNSLQDYLKFIKRGGRLNDGIQGMDVDCIVAVQPERINAHPWFGKVVKIDSTLEQVHLKWLHRHEFKHNLFLYSCGYYYMQWCGF